MSKSPVRIIVFGYHRIGYLCLKELIGHGEEVVAVVTHQDDPNERIWFESVADLARSSSVPVFQPSTPNTPEFVGLLRSLAPDILLSFYYRRLLCPEIIVIPRLGAVNLHGSLLPKYRGRCPVNWVLINGEAQTGVTLHYMTEEADAGDIVAQRAVPIALEDTAFTLSQRLALAAVELFREAFPLIKVGSAPRLPQDHHQATFYGGRQPVDGMVNWEMPARAIYNLVRAVTHPYPGAFTFFRGRKLTLWACDVINQEQGNNDHLPGIVLGEDGKGLLVSTGGGTLRLNRLQIDDGEEARGDLLLKKFEVSVGERLGGLCEGQR